MAGKTKTRSYTVAELKQAAYNAGFRGPNLVIAVAVSLAENAGRDPKAVNVNTNGSVDRGAFQINSIHGYTGNPYDLQTNANQAYKVWQKQGWTAWTVYKNKSYAKNLPLAQRTKPGKSLAVTGDQTVKAGVGANTDSEKSVELPADGKWNGDPLSPDPDNPHYVVSADDLDEITMDDVGVLDGLDPSDWNSRLSSILDVISDPGVWKRAGLFLLAASLVIIGLVLALSSNKTVRQGVELAATKGMVSE